MKTLQSFACTLLAATSLCAVAQNSFAHSAPELADLTIVNHTNTDFSFLGVCGGGVVIKGDPELKPQGELTFKVGGTEAKGEIGYYDNTYDDVINFNYDYVLPGGDVIVKGGDAHYRFIGSCTLTGNQIVIENKS